jgi:hypothetical protein
MPATPLDPVRLRERGRSETGSCGVEGGLLVRGLARDADRRQGLLAPIGEEKRSASGTPSVDKTTRRMAV